MGIKEVREYFAGRDLPYEIKELDRSTETDEVFEMTGHKVGGVCPFGLKQALDVFIDVSLKPFDRVYPAAGSPNSHIEITPDEVHRITDARWVDVCRDDGTPS